MHDWKSCGRVKLPRGFESHPLRLAPANRSPFAPVTRFSWPHVTLAARSRRPRRPGADPRPAPCRRRICPRLTGRPAGFRGPVLARARSGARPRRCRDGPIRARWSADGVERRLRLQPEAVTSKAKTLSKRRSPRSASSSAMASSTALPASTRRRFLQMGHLDHLGGAAVHRRDRSVVSLRTTPTPAAMPWPQPISSKWSAGRTSRAPTAQTAPSTPRLPCDEFERSVG